MSRKFLYSIATILMAVGIIGSLLTFKSSKETISQAETFSGEGVEVIDVDSSNMKVITVPTSERDIAVALNGTESVRDDHRFEANVDHQKLHIEAMNDNWHLFEFSPFPDSLTLTIQVPEKQYEQLRLTSDNGYISAEEIQAKDVVLESDNGKVEGKDLVTSTFHASVDNGILVLNNIEGEIAANVNNGKINLSTDDLEKTMDLKTNNGTITVHSDKEPENVTFLTNVDNGSVDIFGGKYDKSDVVGNGDHVVKLTTNNGRIKVSH